MFFVAFGTEPSLADKTVGIDDPVAVVAPVAAAPAAHAAGLDVLFQAAAAVRAVAHVAVADAVFAAQLTALLAAVTMVLVHGDAAVAARTAVPIRQGDVRRAAVVGLQHRSNGEE